MADPRFGFMTYRVLWDRVLEADSSAISRLARGEVRDTFIPAGYKIRVKPGSIEPLSRGPIKGIWGFFKVLGAQIPKPLNHKPLSP